MNIKPDNITIKQLLLSGKQFVIPRFQREYSWDKKNYQEFIQDMTDNLFVENGNVKSNHYFLGTMVFIGFLSEAKDKEILVVDGQQRLTTITILFSALSDVFKSIGETQLSSQLFRYIMTKDDDGNGVRILKSKTHYPFFAYFIQDLEKADPAEPNSEEEQCIKDTYDYFLDVLSEQKIRTILQKKHGKDLIDALTYIDILKAIRDQVLNSNIILISTTEKEQASKIFEILNAKGKRLAHIDLIKNKVFELLSQEEPVDFAEENWNGIKNILYLSKDPVGFATFYRHYWVSTYKKSPTTKIYDDFLKDRASKNVEACKDFLRNMKINAKYYTMIINPDLKDYNNRKEYIWLVQSLDALSNVFNIVQVRIALLALYDVKYRSLISTKSFKNTIRYLENFHFAYNAILALRSNRLEKIYSSFAIALRKSTNKQNSDLIIEDKLFKPLEKLFPSYESFFPKFTKLIYSKEKKNVSNLKAKYVINRLNCYYSGKEIYEVDGSVEHLIPESAGQASLNIGNLILLEQNINTEAGSKSYTDKIPYYRRSQYKWIESFIQNNPQWSESEINNRALHMAGLFYYRVLGRKMDSQENVQSD